MICFSCNDEFHLNGKHGGQNRRFCYKCMPEGLSNNEQKVIRRSLLRDIANKAKIQLGCAKCGYNIYYGALEWHHDGDSDTKIANPGDILSSGSIKDYEKYLIETEKCILLCANCHREIHAIERGIL